MSRSAIHLRPMGSASAAASVPWYLSGGISAANCVAAYQAVGAVGYAESKVNLANPGTYNCTNGDASPTWATETGWKFNGTSQWLRVAIYPVSTWTVIVKYTGATKVSGALFGAVGTGTKRFSIVPINSTSGVSYGYIANYTRTPELAAGVLAFSPTKCYRNGAQDGDAYTTAEVTLDVLMIIGGRNNPEAGEFTDAYIHALAIYNPALTDSQVLAVSNAMAALP